MLLALILLPSMIAMSHIKHAMTVATTATSNKLLKAMTAMRNIKRVKHPTTDILIYHEWNCKHRICYDWGGQLLIVSQSPTALSRPTTCSAVNPRKHIAMPKSNVPVYLLDSVSFPFPMKLEPTWCVNRSFALSVCPRLLPHTCPQPCKIIGFGKFPQNAEIFISMCLTLFLNKTCFTGLKWKSRDDCGCSKSCCIPRAKISMAAMRAMQPYLLCPPRAPMASGKEALEWRAPGARLRQGRGAQPARPVEPPRPPGQLGDLLPMAPVRRQRRATATAAHPLLGGLALLLGHLLPLAPPRRQGRATAAGPVVEGLAIGAPAVRGVSHSAPGAPRGALC